jgi:hypothetical protein
MTVRLVPALGCYSCAWKVSVSGAWPPTVVNGEDIGTPTVSRGCAPPATGDETSE